MKTRRHLAPTKTILAKNGNLTCNATYLKQYQAITVFQLNLVQMTSLNLTAENYLEPKLNEL